MYKLYQEEDGRYILTIVVASMFSTRSYEYVCDTSEELGRLCVPGKGPHLVDPGLTVGPRIHPNPSATPWDCVMENNKLKK